jgi:hypothetical protein
MMFRIYSLSEAPLYDVMRANYITTGKDRAVSKYLSLSEEQRKVKWRELFQAEHSTLAFAPFVVVGDFRSDVISHLVRHTKGFPRFSVQSSRPDLTGVPRPPSDTNRKMMTLWTPISWMAMCRERLCNLAMKETRETIYNLCLQMQSMDDPFFIELGFASVPMCVYRNGCPYGKRSCGSAPKWEYIHE